MRTASLVASNTIAQMVAKIATMISTLLIVRLIANPDQGLGQIGYAEYAIIMAYAAYFYIICDFGLNAVVVKEITEDKDKSAHYLSNLLSLRVVGAIGLIMIGLVGLSFISSPSYTTVVKLGIVISLVTILSQGLITTANAFFQTHLQYWRSTIAIITGAAVSLAIAALVHYSAGSLLGYVVAAATGSVVMATISLAQVHLQQPLHPAFDIKLWRYLLITALPLGLAILFNLIYVKSGFFILSLVDKSQYGLLDAAYRLFDIAIVVPVFIVNALYPLLITKLQQDWSEFSRFWRKSLAGLLGVSLVVAAAVWLSAPLIIDLIFNNPDFDQSVTILRWLSLAIPLFFLTNLLLWTTITLGKRVSVVVFYLIGAIISLSLNLWLTPQYGYWAVIGVLIVTEIIVGTLMAGQLAIIWRSKKAGDTNSAEPADIHTIEGGTAS